MSCRLHCPLQTTNCSSYGLEEEIVHINEGEGKIALPSTKHNFLITHSPFCLRTIRLLPPPQSFILPSPPPPPPYSLAILSSSSSYDLRSK